MGCNNVAYLDGALQAAASIKPEQQEEPMDIDQQQQLVPAHASQQQAQKQSAHYNCPACCQKEADESRMDLLHLHAVVLADIKPSKPRPAAEIFAAEVTRKVGAASSRRREHCQSSCSCQLLLLCF